MRSMNRLLNLDKPCMGSECLYSKRESIGMRVSLYKTTSTGTVYMSGRMKDSTMKVSGVMENITA